jgi:ribosomal protein S18 acetylase RimI-like enzyme
VNQSLRVRAFEGRDAEDIIRLHRLSSGWFEEDDISRDFIFSAANRADFRFFVAEEDGRVVGFCGVLYYESVGRAEVGPIAVDPAFEGNGVGSALLDYSIKFLSEKMVHRLVARVKEENARAREFFERNGFGFEARLPKFTRKGEAALQYVKFL